MPKREHAIQIYTDGSFNHQNKRGGYGAVMSYDKRMKKFFCKNHWVDTTSIRMEMRAIISALKHCSVGHKIDVYSDCKFIMDVMSDYLRGHSLTNLKANKDLWMVLFNQNDRHFRNGSSLTYNFTRSHSGNTMNEIADDLARKSQLQEKGKVCK